jgi:DNA-binding beta-propeller fold protein YncE
MKSLAGVGVMAIALAMAAPVGWAAPTIQAPAWRVAGTHAVGHRPTDLAFDAAGHAWVANFASGTVSKLDREGRLVGTYPAGPKPRKLAIDGGGYVWVANWGANTVSRLAPDGRLLDRFPVGELPNALAVDTEGQLWVGNMGSHSVMRLSPQGEPLGSFRVERPSGIAIDPSGHVWVTSLTAAQGNLVRFDRAGRPAGSFSVPPMPERVAADSRGHVWVSHMVGPAARKLTVLSEDGTRQVGLWTGFKNQAVAVDAEGFGWVANTEYVIDGEQGYLASNPLTNTVTRLTPGGRILGTYSAGADAWAVKMAPWGDVWVVNHLGDSVTRLTP